MSWRRRRIYTLYYYHSISDCSVVPASLPPFPGLTSCIITSSSCCFFFSFQVQSSYPQYKSYVSNTYISLYTLPHYYSLISSIYYYYYYYTARLESLELTHTAKCIHMHTHHVRTSGWISFLNTKRAKGYNFFPSSPPGLKHYNVMYIAIQG